MRNLSNQQYEDLVSKIPIGIYLLRTTPKGEFSFDYLSQKMAEMLNASVDNIQADSRLAIHAIHPDELDTFVKLNQKSIKKCQPFDWAGRFLINKTVTWLNISATPEILGDGDVLWHGIAVDITKRKLMEESIAQKETLFRNYFELGQIGMAITSLDKKWLQVNNCLCEILGYTREELVKMTWVELTHPDDIDSDLEQFKKLLSMEIERYSMDKRFFHKNGRTVFTSLTVSCQHKIDGSIDYIIASIQDITKRKQVETELSIFATAFQSQVGIVITDARGMILRVNKAFTKTSGYSENELVGETPRILKSSCHDSDFYRNMWESIINEGAWEGEIWDRRKNGEIYPKWLTITTVKDDKGLAMYFIGTHHDITNSKNFEEKLKEISIRDPLTNAYNRRYIFDRLDSMLSEYQRDNNVFSILIIDLDHFKIINDTYGHQAGDFILIEFTKIFTSNSRPYDLIGRYGGEEFIIIYKNTKKEQIIDKIESLLGIVRNTIFSYKDSEIKITFSGGISDSSEFDKSTFSIEKIIEEADNRLYIAKKTGRNKIV